MENYIVAHTICTHHHIQYSFLEALQEHGLIEINMVEEKPCINEDLLATLEKMIRMHYELEINLEGIETVSHLLEQMDQMQRRIVALENKLSIYENQ